MSNSGTATVALTGWRMWVAGARPKTLPAAVVPVLLGSAVADYFRKFHLGHALLALVVSLALQIGVNYANDYSDGIRGTDSTGLRVGPPRLVGWELAKPKAVKTAMALAFAVAAVAGLILAVQTTLWLLVVGFAAIVSAWFYTGGPRPYGYAGLGELFVFVFFGLVATLGTVFVQARELPAIGWWCGVGAGLVAMALLVVNNLRDIPGDTVVGKKTLAVRVGDERTRFLYIGCLAGTLLIPIAVAIVAKSPLPLGTLATGALAWPPVSLVRRGTKGRALVDVLVRTGRFQLMFGAVLAASLVAAGHFR
jgi:1,4-dihydroxy-2-naphthoate polyprenyltransferase